MIETEQDQEIDNVTYQIVGARYNSGEWNSVGSAVRALYADGKITQWSTMFIRVYSYKGTRRLPSFDTFKLLGYCRHNGYVRQLILSYIMPSEPKVNWQKEGF